MTRTNTEFHKEEGKPMLDLLHVHALIEEGHVCSFGAKKYGLRNWEEHADKWSLGQLVASALRHIFQWMIGEDFDKESGLHHFAHARWNLGAAYELQLAKKGKDDRSKLQKKNEDTFFHDKEKKLLLIDEDSLSQAFSTGQLEIIGDGDGHVHITRKPIEIKEEDYR